MPTNVTSLAEFVKQNTKVNADFEALDIILAGGMLGVLHTQGSSNGTVHQYPKVTTAPVIGFRVPGAGSDNEPAVRSLVTLNLSVLDATAHEDMALANIYKGGPAMFMQKRAFENLAAALDTAEKQFFYGTNNDADGFVGLVEATGFIYQDDPNVIDGGAAVTGEDIWVIRTSEDDLSLIGNGDNALDFGDEEIHLSTLRDGDNKPYTGYSAPLMCWLGLQVGSVNSIIRIANVDTSSADNEALVQTALSRFPSRRPATHILMSRAARLSIQLGRQSYNALGAPAETPSMIDAVPIVISEALVPGAVIEDAP